MFDIFFDPHGVYGEPMKKENVIMLVEYETRANRLRHLVPYFGKDADIALAFAKNVHTPNVSLQKIYKEHYNNHKIGYAIAKHPKASEALLLKINPPSGNAFGGWSYRADVYTALTLREDLTEGLLNKIVANISGTTLPNYLWRNPSLTIQQVNHIWDKMNEGKNSHTLYRLLENEEEREKNFNPFYCIKWMLAEDVNKVAVWCRQIFGDQAQTVLVNYLQGYDFEAEQVENLPLEWLVELVLTTNDVPPVMA